MNILLLKSSNQKSCKYAQLLKDKHASVLSIDPLEVEFIVDDSVKELICSYRVLVFTSVKAVSSLKYMKCDLNSLVDGKTCYAVGPSTAYELKALGFKDVRGEICGNAAKLAEFIRSDIEIENLLFLCGNLADESNLYNLTSDGFTIKSVVCYETKQSRILKDELSEAFKNQKNLVTVIFSPSIASYFYDWCFEFFANDTAVPVIAIGPTTAQSILEIGKPLCLRGVSNKPNPESLLEVLETLNTT